MKKSIIFLVLVFSTLFFLHADIYIKQKVHTDPVSMMGQTQPAKDEVSEQWIGDQKLATITSKQSIVIDMNQKTLLMINHATKSYVEMSLPLDMSKYFPEQMAQMMNQTMAGMTVTVNPNGQTKKVGKWNCKGYDVAFKMTMMGMPINMNMAVWASTDVPFDWKKVGEKMLTEMMKAQMRLSDTAVSELKKIEGYWISMVMTMNMMGANIKVTSMVEEITEKTPGPGVYSVPAGYTKKDKLDMKDLNQR